MSPPSGASPWNGIFGRVEGQNTTLRSEPRRVQLGLRDALRVVGPDGTVSIVKIVFLSPCVENLKVKKVIKVSYLNKESRQCFGIPYVYFTYSYLDHILVAMLHVDRR